MTNATDTHDTLVLGGTGKIGRRVAERLLARGVPTRVGSRSGVRPSTGRTVRPGRRCWRACGRPTSLTTRTSRSPARPRRSARSPSWPCRAASGGWCCWPGAASRRPSRPRTPSASPAPTSRSCARRGSRRTSARTLADLVVSGEVALPAGDVPEPFVDADDIADVVVAALTDDRHIGEVYELTGPALLTFAEAVDEIARATGREIRYVPISIEEFAAAAAAERAARRGRRPAHLRVRRGPRRPQRPPRRRRAASARPRAARLQRLRPRRGGQRPLGPE